MWSPTVHFRRPLGPCNSRDIHTITDADERCRFVTGELTRAAPAVNRGTPLAAERPYLHLVPRDEQAATIAAAIAHTSALDARLAGTPPDPTSSPVRVGTLERFPCQYEDGFVAWRYHGVGGRDLVVRVPAELDTDEADAATRRYMSELLAIQHRLRTP
jgi:hypothetical protein